MTLSRRMVLGAAALGASAGLAACAAGSVSQGLSQAASDAKLIANGLAGVLPQLGAVAGLSAATIAQIGQRIADVTNAAGAIAAAATTSAAQPLVQQIEADVNAIVAALAGIPLPSPIGPAIEAASILLPVIEAAVGLVVSAVPARAAMSPAEARAILAAASRRKR